MLFGQGFKNNRSSNGTELHMPADDAQWQVRNVKRHMRLLKEVLTRMTEDEKEHMDLHPLSLHVTEAKNTPDVYCCHSPTQRFTERNRWWTKLGGGTI